MHTVDAGICTLLLHTYSLANLVALPPTPHCAQQAKRDEAARKEEENLRAALALSMQQAQPQQPSQRQQQQQPPYGNHNPFGDLI